MSETTQAPDTAQRLSARAKAVDRIYEESLREARRLSADNPLADLLTIAGHAYAKALASLCVDASDKRRQDVVRQAMEMLPGQVSAHIVGLRART